MKNSIKSIALCFFVATSFLLTSCSSDDDNQVTVDNTITGIASKNPEFSILVEALVKTDLAATLQGNDNYTVFAPTNAAFTAYLGTSNINAVPTATLKELLLNHVLVGTKKAADLSTKYEKTLAKGAASTTNTLSMYVNVSGSTVKLNGAATVTTADVLASNGVIHIVDKVIDLPTVVTHATANPNFTSLVGALTGAGQPDFVSILSGTGPFTVFAPTNAAFTALNTELAPGGIASVSTANLTRTLQYHVVSPANVLSSTLTEGQTVTPILTPSQTFKIQLAGGAKILDASNRLSNIVVTDVQCSNGVIHAIDKVLLPVFPM
ncbi:fasciclin domain-containing protein [Flavobacterium sp. F-380]|uniref:Fasciclin domain-containing protein n=1 Tax=Flavobacterium kayseriense TaxID=2764714 RepID=A0ABR7J6P2_9FLAO|nr:fasciclin domain-containing protein [Flavobacterium kayseriense]MBC5841123.1 fasciclin domain-containing protein [Flavobacterium kayseriense]MBC5847651.1 fasciclin domain-containing protein [Flavobacterium kayseriense]